MADTKIEWTDFEGGNRIVTTGGYVITFCPQHPNAKSNGYVYEHRLVMENHLKRFLQSSEHVHHINHDPSDNRIENLELISSKGHAKKHASELSEERKSQRNTVFIEAAHKRRKPRVSVPCVCGCGQIIITPDNKGRDKKYVQGHNQKGKHWRWNCG